MMSDAEELQHRQRRSRSACLIVGALFVTIGYCLSPPFVLLISEQWGVPDFDSLMTIYHPLEILADKFESVQTFYDWYFGLFGYS